jgi:chromosome segregation ATPase
MSTLPLNEIALPYIRAGLLATRPQSAAHTGLKIAEACAIADTDTLVRALLSHIDQLGKSAEQAHRARAAAEDRVMALESCLADTREQIEAAMVNMKAMRQEMAEDSAVIAGLGEEMKKLQEENKRLKTAKIWDADANDMRPLWGGCEWRSESDSSC